MARAQILALLACLLVASAANGQALSSAEVRAAIVAAGSSLRWTFIDAGEGKLIGSLTGPGRQRLDVDIEFNAGSYSVRPRRSVGVPDHDLRMRSLGMSIDRALAAASSAAAGSVTRPAGEARRAGGRDVVAGIRAVAAATERRNALVIGNASYGQNPLRNPINDARAMARALADVGFDVQLVEDATQAGMRRALRSFADEIRKGGVGLFYYAGHGVQANGRNFLVPVNAEVDREYEAEFHSVDVNLVLSLMDAAKNSLNIVILDACRTNPFARGFSAPASGLAPMDAPAGTFIAFATAPGAIASDGAGANGIYTRHLLDQIGRPGLPIEQLFKQVRIGVMRDTNGNQTPWESSSLRGDFVFVPGASEASVDIAGIVAETLRRERESLIQDALDRQRKQLEAQGMLAVTSAASPPPETSRLPQAADRWVYRLKPLRSSGERRYVVEVVAASTTGVLDRVSIDGGEWNEWVHSRGGYLAIQGVSLFSPYLPQFDDLQPGQGVAGIALRDQAACTGTYTCSAKGRIVGRETLLTAAGAFDTIKAVIEQDWHPVQPGVSFSADQWGSRTITVWYAPQVKRAVKYSSRVTAGSAPMEANFDLELLSYHLTGG